MLELFQIRSQVLSAAGLDEDQIAGIEGGGFQERVRTLSAIIIVSLQSVLENYRTWRIFC